MFNKTFILGVILLITPFFYAQKPNVILIMTDDQGYGEIGAHGNNLIDTPNLDKLHEESTRLTNFHVSPTCAPTRAALMTGHYSNKTGVWHTIGGRSLLLKGEKTMANTFSENGYNTGIFGKWHLGDNYPYRPKDRGFKESVIHGAGGIWQTPDYWNNDYFDDTYRHNGELKQYKGYCTDVWFEESLRFIEDNKDEPFFCYITPNAPHGPLWVEEKYIDPFKDNKEIPKPEVYGMIKNVDENIGKLINRLDELNLTNKTILIFTTDNGTSGGVTLNKKGFVTKGYNAGMRGKKNTAYEGGHRVPFFIKWPNGKIPANRDINKVTAHVDIFPTLINLCDLNEKEDLKLDGTNISSLIYNTGNWKNRTLVVDSQRAENLEKWKKSCVMTEDYRLVNGKELYDIKKDPGQLKDIAKDNQEIVETLKLEYDKWWDNVSVNKNVIAPINVGNKIENSVHLTCHDWHSDSKNPFQQDLVRKGINSKGWWYLNVENNGKYKITLRRYPKHLNANITGTVPDREKRKGTTTSKSAKAQILNITEAQIKIGKYLKTSPVNENDKEISFNVKLKEGNYKLETEFFNKNEGLSLGAYFVEVTKL